MTNRLPDGWGGDSPADDTMVRAFAESWATLNEQLGLALASSVVRTDDYVACDSHVPFPFANVATLLRPVLRADDPVLDEITEFFAPDDESTPYLVWSATPTPSFSERGWSLMGHPPLMLRPAGAPVRKPPPDGLEIVPVRDAETLAVFDATLSEAYPIPELIGRRQFGDGLLDAPGWSMYLGLLDGEPVGTAAARVAEGFVDVEWISTHERARGRGIGEALTWAATLAAPDLPAMLFASDPGQPVYERMGYLRLARLTLWVGARAAVPSS